MYNRYLQGQAAPKEREAPRAHTNAPEKPPERAPERLPERAPDRVTPLSGGLAGIKNLLSGLLGSGTDLSDLLLILVLLLLYLEKEDEEILIILSALVVMGFR